MKPCCRNRLLKTALCLLAFCIQMGCSLAFAATYTGDLVQIQVSDAPEFGMMVNVRPPNTSNQFVKQYFAISSWGTVVYFTSGATNFAFSSGSFENSYFTQVSNIATTTATGGTITSIETLGSTGLRLTQTVNHENTNYFITKTWQLTNTGATAYTGLKLLHGGDTYFGGDDRSYGFYAPNQGMVYLRNNATTTWGLMGFYADASTPSTAYNEGSFVINRNQMNAGQLSNTVDGRFVDAGYSLQWNRASLEPGETWNIIAYEIYTPPGDMQVIPPGARKISNDATTTLPFTVQNLGNTPLTVALTTQPLPAGWTASLQGAMSRTIPANGSINVNVNVVVTGVAPGTQANLGLTATSGSVVTATSQLTVSTLSIASTPSFVNFGSVSVSNGAMQSIILQNTSAVSITLGSLYSVAPFGVGTDNCSNKTLIPGATCTVVASFFSTSTGAFSSNLNIPVQSPVLLTATVLLSGSGVVKTDQNQLVLSASANRIPSGRSISLNVSGGNLPGTEVYAVIPSGNAQCFIKITSNRQQTLLKTSGGAGTCSVTASNPGNDQFNPVTSNTTVITVY